MQTKLTLRVDDKLIKSAKKLAEKKGISLSKMVAEFFQIASTKQSVTYSRKDAPISKSLRGIIKLDENDENSHKNYLEDKYL